MTDDSINSMFNPYGAELPNVRYFEIFNKNATLAPEGTRFERDSDEYKHNIGITRNAGLAFRAAAEKSGMQTQYPMYHAGLFYRGNDEISVHKDDVAKVMEILDGLKADGIIDSVQEIPKEKSFNYALTKAKFTPH